jgi:hypothetical protein
MLPLSHCVRALEFLFVEVARLNQFAYCPALDPLRPTPDGEGGFLM